MVTRGTHRGTGAQRSGWTPNRERILSKIGGITVIAMAKDAGGAIGKVAAGNVGEFVGGAVGVVLAMRTLNSWARAEQREEQQDNEIRLEEGQRYWNEYRS